MGIYNFNDNLTFELCLNLVIERIPYLTLTSCLLLSVFNTRVIFQQLYEDTIDTIHNTRMNRSLDFENAPSQT